MFYKKVIKSLNTPKGWCHSWPDEQHHSKCKAEKKKKRKEAKMTPSLADS